MGGLAYLGQLLKQSVGRLGCRGPSCLQVACRDRVLQKGGWKDLRDGIVAGHHASERFGMEVQRNDSLGGQIGRLNAGRDVVGIRHAGELCRRDRTVETWRGDRDPTVNEIIEHCGREPGVRLHRHV